MKKEVIDINKLKTISTFGLLACTVSIAVILLLTYFGDNVGDFTLGIEDDIESRSYLSLSETITFDEATSMLVAKSYDNAQPIGSRLPNNGLPEDINELCSKQSDGKRNAFVGGSLNGNGFMTYTFYLKNVGNDSCTYQYAIDIVSATKNIDAAIRVMVIHEREATSLDENKPIESIVYAKMKGANQEDVGEAEYGTTKFASNSIVCEEDVNDFYAGSIDKFTVILWIEGWDADTTNKGDASIVGGIIKLAMRFRIIDKEVDA